VQWLSSVYRLRHARLSPLERGIFPLPFRDADALPIAPSGGSLEPTTVTPEPASSALNTVDDLLERMVARGASDLHVAVGSEPVVRVNGKLERLDEFPALTPDDSLRLLYRMMSTEQQKQLEIKRQLDLSYSIPGLARFRVNIYFQRESLGAAFRMIPSDIKSLESLGMPAQLHDLAKKPRGLVLVTGPTGSGKSTTLAAIIDEINQTRSDHIMTIEDPIEFLHSHKGCVVNQREIGPDATSFAEALRGALRQDPDVILLGEMRDLETISTALTAAETGHLVFATLHTQDAPSTVDRLIDVFPAAQQEQIRVQIAATLQAVVTQTLVPTADGVGRVPACEILLPDDAVRNLIRQGKVEQIYSVMQTGTSRGMQTLEQSLAELVMRGAVSQDMALSRSSRPDQLLGLLQRGGFAVGGLRAAEG
jgi:twitching motility protein PilT